jgi:hypothetical protein
MPAPTGIWFTSQSAKRGVLGGTAVAAYPAWFYAGATVHFGHEPPRKKRKK